VFFEQRQHIGDIVLALAGAALRLLGGEELQLDEVRDGGDAETRALAEVDDLGMLDGGVDARVFRGKLYGGALLQRSGSRGQPVVTALVTTRVLESSAAKSFSRHVRVGGNGQIDVEGAPRLRRV
jgi:hypothetical protein